MPDTFPLGAEGAAVIVGVAAAGVGTDARITAAEAGENRWRKAGFDGVDVCPKWVAAEAPWVTTGRLIVWADSGVLDAGFANEERSGTLGADRVVRVAALGAGRLARDEMLA